MELSRGNFPAEEFYMGGTLYRETFCGEIFHKGGGFPSII
jgi:hypothetical protein